jgi:UDP-glucose 4-epimerase
VEEVALNILVTGGAGYIGSICSEVLLQRGHNVVVLDNLQEGRRVAVPAAAVFCLADLSEPTQIEKVFSSHKIDAVMHFAAEALVGKSMLVPSKFYAANVACGINLLDAMIRHGVNKIIFSSTAATYGEARTVPITEEHPAMPINPYGKSKLTFEQILADYRAYTGLQYVVLRYFNVAGASAERGESRRDETHLIPKVLDTALGKISRMEVYGTDYPTQDGSCVRDYVHVLDIADSHIRVLEEIDRLSGEVFNVATSSGYSNLEVFRTAERVTGRSIPVQLCARRPGDPAVLVASSEKLKRVLGWEAAHSSLEEILQSAWDWRLRFPRGYPD